VSAPPSVRRRRRWPLIALAAVVAVLVVAGILLTGRIVGTGSIAGRPAWVPPPQTLLASSMAQQPKPGWTVDIGALGLPDGSKIATSDEAYWSNPFVGAIDDRAFFLAGTPGSRGFSDAQWWLIGIASSSGEALFPPTRLGSGDLAPKCVLNGPDMVLCLVDDVRDHVHTGGMAWVVDAHTGAVGYTGPTRVAVGGDYMIDNVGDYAVATSADRGVYGVGPSADLTWFVPGDGRLRGDTSGDGITMPPTRTNQNAANRSQQKIVFSAVDGTVTTPDLGAEHDPADVIVYPGGLAVRTKPSAQVKQVVFFDENGIPVASKDLAGTFPDHLPGLPVVVTDSAAIVFSSRGDALAEIPDYNSNNAFLVGSTLYAEDSATNESAWRPYDLKKGSISGPTCHERMDGFFASDGTVGVFKQDNPNIGLVIKAVDLGTCTDAWSMRPPVGSFRDVWRANSTLVTLSDDATELSSLVSP
jgi:hypothetical protein